MLDFSQYDWVRILVAVDDGPSEGELQAWVKASSGSDSLWYNAIKTGWGGTEEDSKSSLAPNEDTTVDIYLFADEAGSYKVTFKAVQWSSEGQVAGDSLAEGCATIKVFSVEQMRAKVAIKPSYVIGLPEKVTDGIPEGIPTDNKTVYKIDVTTTFEDIASAQTSGRSVNTKFCIDGLPATSISVYYPVFSDGANTWTPYVPGEVIYGKASHPLNSGTIDGTAVIYAVVDSPFEDVISGNVSIRLVDSEWHDIEYGAGSGLVTIASFDQGITGKLGSSYIPKSTANTGKFSSLSIRPMQTPPVTASEVDAIWAIPIQSLDSIDNALMFRDSDIVSFVIDDQGRFEIGVDLLDKTALGYLFLLVNTQAQNKKDRIVSFLSIRGDGDFNLINFPVADIVGVLNLGEITRGEGKNGDEGVSSYTVQDLSAYFVNSEAEQLEEMALASNALKALKNYYINDRNLDDPNNDKYYEFSLTHNFDFGSTDEYSLLEYMKFENLYQNDIEIIMTTNLGQNITKNLRPSAPVTIDGQTYDHDNPIELGTSPNGGDNYSYFKGGLASPIPVGFWTLEYPSGDSYEVAAEFDFSMHDFIDNGKPLGYVPLLKLNVENDLIKSVTVKWYFNDGTTFRPISNADGLKKSVFGLRIQHRSNFNIPITGCEHTESFAVDENVVMDELPQKIRDAKDVLGAGTEGALYEAVVAAETFVAEKLALMQKLGALGGFTLYYQTFGVNYAFNMGNRSADQELMEQLKEKALEPEINEHIATLEQAMNEYTGG